MIIIGSFFCACVAFGLSNKKILRLFFKIVWKHKCSLFCDGTHIASCVHRFTSNLTRSLLPFWRGWCVRKGQHISISNVSNMHFVSNVESLTHWENVIMYAVSVCVFFHSPFTSYHYHTAPIIMQFTYKIMNLGGSFILPYWRNEQRERVSEICKSTFYTHISILLWLLLCRST